ncbi:hypothetical protein [Roseiconus nitratireducens]|uniref:hypothetical protein n=1 Tax=Roseiconus nitratireducens TaxID=2605748 RepID=UPI0013754435|nr:hypothetical protein [Roseiconus nitratireducens]
MSRKVGSYLGMSVGKSVHGGTCDGDWGSIVAKRYVTAIKRESTTNDRQSMNVPVRSVSDELGVIVSLLPGRSGFLRSGFLRSGFLRSGFLRSGFRSGIPGRTPQAGR